MTNAKDRLNHASELARAEKYLEALEIADAVINEYPEWFEGYYEKATIYSTQGLWREAIVIISKAIELDKNEPMLYFARARWLIYIDSYSEAIFDLTYLIELCEKLNDKSYLELAYFYRAIASSYLERYEDVLADCSNVSDDCVGYASKVHRKTDLVLLAINKLKGN